MIDPKELIEECKSHLRDNSTHEQQYKTDIRKLITALERALSLGVVVGRSEQLLCEDCNNAKRYLKFRVCEPCLIKGKYIAK
jgi:hypothetical protein